MSYKCLSMNISEFQDISVEDFNLMQTEDWRVMNIECVNSCVLILTYQ